jgi:GntR family transcriptional regulator
MYRRIAEDLRQKIESGELGHGDQLPTELELRELYDASRNTVRDAVKWLTTRGMVRSRPGQGTFVAEKIAPFVTTLDLETGFGVNDDVAYQSEIKARQRKAAVSHPTIEIRQATGDLASELHLEPGSAVVIRHQERFIDGTPWSLQHTFYPMQYVDAGARRLIDAKDMPDGAVRYLQDTLDIEQVGWRDKITVRAPETTETTFFKLPDDGRVAVVEIHRIAFEKSGEPLRLTITAYPADRNQFVMNVGRVPREPEVIPPFNAEDSARPRTSPD